MSTLNKNLVEEKIQSPHSIEPPVIDTAVKRTILTDDLNILNQKVMHWRVMQSNMDVNGTPSCLHVPIVREHDTNVNVHLEKPIDESNMDVNDIPSYLNVPVVHEHDASINVQLEKPIDEVSNTKSILKDQNAEIYIEELTDDLKNRNSGHEDVAKKDQSFDPMEVDETKVDCVKGDHSHIDVQHDLHIFAASVHMEDPIEIEHPKSIQDNTESQCTFLDELLPSLSTERRIIDMHRRKLAEETSKLSKRKRKLDIFDKYVDSTREYNLANQELTIVEYIIGFKLHASVPWHTVDYMFIPVNIGRIHWVLIVLSFNDRCLYVYDSLSSTRLDASVSLEVKKLSELLPTYLTISDFYKKKLEVRINFKSSSNSNFGFSVLLTDGPCVGIDWSSVGFLSTDYPSVVIDLSSVGGKHSSFMELCCVLPANVHLLPLMGTRTTIEKHLKVHRIIQNYTFWFHHGERLGEPLSESKSEDEHDAKVKEYDSEDEVEELLRDLYPNLDGGPTHTNCVEEDPNLVAGQFYKLLSDFEIDDDSFEMDNDSFELGSPSQKKNKKELMRFKMKRLNFENEVVSTGKSTMYTFVVPGVIGK
ncbi:hypothetical protein BC332_02676 [Capsicum chinense]|nr:hypothetical protein BC332_02676 [Capsicum chinense]